ncbi:MAG: TrkA family potassium uptake protein [Dehalococcoidales bacterium]|nr:TrkA family potassium uptake protein [Dehalococcoidales bacterium]
MYIIVVGGGRLGYYLTKGLLAEGHEVLLLEKDSVVCDTITEELGSVCFRGDGCETTVLNEVGTSRADMFIAVTGDDEDNLVSCQVAKHKFNVPTTIARLRNPDNELLFKKLGIDITISATNLILEAIEREVTTHPLTHVLTMQDKGWEMVDIRILPEAATVGKSIKDLVIPPESKLTLVIPHTDKPYVPTANSVLREGDRVIALTTPQTEEALRAALSGT